MNPSNPPRRPAPPDISHLSDLTSPPQGIPTASPWNTLNVSTSNPSAGKNPSQLQLMQQRKKQKQKQMLVLGIVGLLIGIAGAGGGLWYLKNGRDQTKKNELAKNSAVPDLKKAVAKDPVPQSNSAAAKNLKVAGPANSGKQSSTKSSTKTADLQSELPAFAPPRMSSGPNDGESAQDPAVPGSPATASGTEPGSAMMPEPKPKSSFGPSNTDSSLPPIGSRKPSDTDKMDSEGGKSLPVDEFTAKAVELYKAKKLFNKNEYAGLRKLAAAEFAKLHDAKIREGLGVDYDAMQEWFAKRPDIQEEFYLAIDPSEDNIAGAFKVFNTLRQEFPEKLASYGSLAIATAVVWDYSRERDHTEFMQHVSRAKAKVDPANFLDAVGNFRYLVEMEPHMQGRAMYAPWEFLVYLVDHRTPRTEREWSLQNFGRDRTMFGSCYSKVPYDYTMLNSGSREAKLNNQDYTLANILKFGGVCSYQADFASRVGKNIGVPAAYVTGEGSGLELHAWVMWVELKQVTATALNFTLESHGRYGTDHYYVGNLQNPQNLKPMTDRELEIDLQATGMDVVAKRHVGLILEVYPQLKEQLKLTTAEEFSFLRQLLKLSPGWRGSWVEVAKLARANAGNKEFTKPVMELLEQMFLIYARVPDFTWQVFDDFAAFEEEPKRHLALYERLCVLYEVANRPDLACEARMKYAGMLVEAKRTKEAVDMLANCVKKFPNEGRYIPKVLDKIDALCAEFPNSGPVLVQFYAEFLPMVKKLRGNTPTDYAVKMYTRAVALFEKHNATLYAEAAKAELKKLTGGKAA